MPSAFLDANALYGIYIRDALLEFAAAKFFRPHWSSVVVAELIGALERNLRSSRKNFDALAAALENAFPFASVHAGEVSARQLEGVHAGDRHVLAAALSKSQCTGFAAFIEAHAARIDATRASLPPARG